MATAFKNSITGIIGTESHRVYKCPTSTTATVIGLSLSNISSSEATANVLVIANTSFQAHMIKNAPVPAGGSLMVIAGQKIVLEAGSGATGDEILVTSSSSSASLDVVAAILEDVN